MAWKEKTKKNRVIKNNNSNEIKSLLNDKKDEYLMLRDEILFHMNKTYDLRNMMYVSLIAILAFIYKTD